MLKKPSLKEQVIELKAQVQFLAWLVNKHIYEDRHLHEAQYYPVYYTGTGVNPDPITGWKVT